MPDYGAMVTQANQAAKRHPLVDMINSPYNPFGINPMDLINQLARRTTGDFFFPKERLIRFRKQRAEQEQTTRDVQAIFRQMERNQPPPPEAPMPQRLGTRP